MIVAADTRVVDLPADEATVPESRTSRRWRHQLPRGYRYPDPSVTNQDRATRKEQDRLH